MAQLISVKLSRFDGSPWGFRLQGGKDFGTPLIVQKVNGGSPAEAAGLRAGDAVIKVNNTDTFNLRHKDAQDVIVRAGNNFEVTVQRGGTGTWKPNVTPVTPTLPNPQPVAPVSNVAPVTKTSLAAKKQDGPLIGSGHNFSPKPFLNGTSEGPIKSIVNKQYNSPVGIYSEETIAETLSAQAEVLAGGVLGVNFKKNEKNYNAENSEVFKMVQEADKEPKTPESAEPTAQSGVVTPSSPAVTGLRPVSAPETKQQPTTTPQTSLPPGQNICADCERLIVGVFVRIKDKNLHVECFKCSTCGTSLKNVGYYNINNKLYCDIHAKLVARQNAPAGLVPLTVPSSGKAPAGTISAALANVGAGAPLAPLSPSLSNHSSPQPFSTCNRSSPNGPQRSPHLANGSSSSNRAECNGVCNSKTFTSTLTIQTGNEVGSTDSNKLASDNNLTNTKSNRDFIPAPKIGEICEIVFNPVIIDESPEVCCTEPGMMKTHSYRKQPTRLGTSPVSPPSLRPVQAPTSNNISGPKPFGSSSITPSSLASPPILNSGNSTLLRPQSQTVTETTYFAESNRREAVRTVSSSNPASVRSKSLVWPPPKPIEDITYPTASPLYINPNPALNERHQRNIREEREIEEIQDLREIEIRERTGQNVVEIMDNVSCPGPVYRRVELFGAQTRNETRRECVVPRPASTEGVKRSLTPTRITQPVPQPWTATVTTGSNLYEQAYPVIQDRQVCREIYQQQESSICQQQRTCQRFEPEPPQESIREEEEEKSTATVQVEEVEEEDDGVDLRDIVPPSVAICPKGVDGQHEFFTETTEKDVGDLHIKKTTIYEKTVELLSPDRATSPNVTESDERSDDKEIRQISTSECQRRSVTLDREVEDISGRRSVAESAEVVGAAVDAQQLVERIKKEEEEEQQEQQLIEEKVTTTRQEKRVCFEEQGDIEDHRQSRGMEVCRESSEQQCRNREEERVDEVSQERSIADERYRELTEEIKIQKSFEQRDLEEQRRQSLREQVEVHQSLREQQAPAEKRQQTLQERRLSTRLGQQQTSHQQDRSEVQSACGGKKHVQFMTQSESGIQSLPPVKNSTPKEWRSEMVKALTTVSDRPYSPLVASALDHETTTKKEYYSHEVTRERYEEVPQVLTSVSKDRYAESYFATSNEPIAEPCRSKSQETRRVISPFQEALTTAPDRPYTPLGHYEDVVQSSTYEWHQGSQERRSQTPVIQTQPDGYCPPAEILYTDSRSQEMTRRRERSLSRRSITPQPLPTPPPDYRLRDSSKSPARSRPETPGNRSLMTGLKKPDTIPAYQRNLVAMKKAPVGGQTYVPSRSPTPTPGRSKSPAQGPPEPPVCFVKAQAPKIREDPPPKCKTQSSISQYTKACEKEFHQYVPPSNQEQSFSYHVEEDTPSCHIVQDYARRKTVCYSEDIEPNYVAEQEETVDKCRETEEEYERTQKLASIEIKKSCDSNVSICPRQEHSQSDSKDSCLINQFSRSQPSLPCPTSSHSRFPKTGVRVLPPCPKILGTDRSQICQSTSDAHTVDRESQVCRRTISQSQSSAFRETKPCPETGVTILPCKAYSNSGTKAGVVVVPCEGPSAACPQAGVCVIPTADRSGVCVSPRFGSKSSGICSNRRSGSWSIDVGTSSESGVQVTPSKDGSGALCVAPCNMSGCSQSIPKNQCSVASRASLPFPQIPLPHEKDEPQCPPVQFPYQSSNDLGFQPIHEPRTNLGSQLTRLTLKQNKHVVQVYKPQAQCSPQAQYQSCPTFAPISKTQNLVDPPNLSSHPDLGSGVGGLGSGSKSGSFAGSSAPKRGRGILNQASGPGTRVPLCGNCNSYVRGPFITALGQIWCPEHFTCVNGQCRRPLQDIGFVEEKGQLYCEYCFEQFIAPSCNKCNKKVKGDCLNAIGKHFHPECFNCSYCGKLFGNNPFFLEEGLPYCEADWNELFTTKCFACGFPVEAGDRWVEALSNNYHSQCFNCTMCKKNLEGQSFYAKGGRPFCKNHAR